eukprot:391421-Amphidinium_carterae.1
MIDRLNLRFVGAIVSIAFIDMRTVSILHFLGQGRNKVLKLYFGVGLARTVSVLGQVPVIGAYRECADLPVGNLHNRDNARMQKMGVWGLNRSQK